jgi:predicted metal-binding membrane protein
MTGRHWIGMFVLILSAWIVLYALALPVDMGAPGLTLREGIRDADFWQNLVTLTPDAAGFLRVAAMWSLMSAAMMAPTALPAFATYDDLTAVSPEARFWHLVAGYLAVWIGFSVLAAGLQMLLFRVGLVGALGGSRSGILSAGLLFVAGLYQFSPQKAACLSKCRQPLTFFMQHWPEGPWRNGLRLGLVCLGCCWALMLLAFVGGAMNLAFMGLAMVIMVLEKLPDVGRYVTRPLGAALIAAAGWMVMTAM